MNHTQRTERIQHFLLVFDHERNELVDQFDFGSDGKRALAAYAEKEREYEGRRNFEIVLIGSDSIETIKLTHANYFDGSISIGSKYLDLAMPSP
jgi:hypothetical protein